MVEHEVDQVFKFFLTRRKASYEQPYGKALLATLYWLFFFKQNGFKFWAKFLERFLSLFVSAFFTLTIIYLYFEI